MPERSYRTVRSATDPPDDICERQFELMVGVLRSAGDNGYWIDREALEVEEKEGRSAGMAFKLVIVVVALAIAAVAIVFRAASIEDRNLSARRVLGGQEESGHGL